MKQESIRSFINGDVNQRNLMEVVRAKSHLKAGSNTIARYIRKNRGLSVDNNEAHRILVEEAMAEKDPRKCVRKKP